jgi:uncharacterized protein (TIGR02996 family)
MLTHDGFERSLDEDPYDWDLRRVYADWLEDRGGEGRACFQRLVAEHMLSPEMGRYWSGDTLPQSPWGLWGMPNEWPPGHSEDSWDAHRRASKSRNAAYRDLERFFLGHYAMGWRPKECAAAVKAATDGAGELPTSEVCDG